MSAIGIDLDGTLAKYDRFIAPDVIDEPDFNFVNLVHSLYAQGHNLYIWSCRADHIIEQWLIKYNLAHYFDGINTSPGTSDSIKPNFDYYIGDEAIRWSGNNIKRILDIIYGNPKPNRYTTERDKDFMSHQPVPYLAGTGRGFLDMFETHWRNLWKKHDTDDKQIALMTICSHAKPYSKSFIHSMIRKRLHYADLLDSVDYIHISNAGIIPSNAEMTYPFNAYDHDGSQMSEDTKLYFSKVLEKRMRYWASHYANYKHLVVYLRKGKTWYSTAVGLSLLKPIMVEVSTEEYQYPKFVALPDPDDCLTSEANLTRLCDAINKCIS